MAKRKILQVIATLVISGAEGQLFELVRRMDKGKYSIIVCVLRERGYYAQKLEELGIKVVELRKNKRLDLGMFFKLVRLMKVEKIDLVHTYMFTSNTWGRFAALLAGVPIIIAGERGAARWKSKFYLLIDRVLARFSDKIMANSNGVVDFYVSESGISRDKFLVVHNGVDVDKFRRQQISLKIKQELNIPQGNAVIGTIGRLMAQKGYKFFLMAAKLIQQRFPSVNFLIVGEGLELEELRSLSHKLEIADNVIFAGFRDDIPEILSIFDIFVSSSLYEGLPNVVLEAMASGLPVVATNVEGSSEVVIDGKTGFLVPAKNYMILAEKVLFFLENVDLARKMGQMGKERVEKEFSFDKMVREMCSFYDEISHKRLDL